jgi:hypothetical protein
MDEGLNYHNSKQVWNGRTWIKTKLCENAVRNTATNFGRGMGVIQCYDNTVSCKVLIKYNEVEKDSCLLCEDCCKALKKSASRHGYVTKKVPI